MAIDVPGFLDRLKSWLEWHSKTCVRCRRPYPEGQPEAAQWASSVVPWKNKLYPVAWVCPDCTTPEEFAERQIRDATTKYRNEGNGWIPSPKLTDDDL
ncbi:Uncharacterised protein [Mycobacteroides abscessus subsp. abscessus]|uniref:Bacteriophage protein n=1 Tax=Mycobacteroides abscessus TaxID=36809 RepID=A0AB33T7K4_9MYCO|nr:hypothetical protein [Mycobacteroides abscessus]EIC65114.1 hypothetical protein S7W_18775 [Mycobacteroides abscessus M94]MBE5439472.1 hypothetical protein [Mycobacteroides abscessus]MBE5466419.1 hypothetical protein [Mycobacteroides abscessus]MBN7545992.1 hypothetical protein [Mycobacteroides abscessus subsp. abscessus]MDB2206926.1 hypothetical protein [Mycobacteroides abscessus subsp. massiliense]